MNKQEIEQKLEDIILSEQGVDFSELFSIAKNSFNLALDIAAENAKIKEDELETESYKKADEFAEGKSYSYTTDMDGCLLGVNTFEIDKQSILNLKL